jgi:hypothetical protein
MTPLRDDRRVRWAGAGVALLIVILGLALRPAEQGSEMATATSATADPRSCKPTSPIQVTLTADSRGLWRLRLAAQSRVEEAVVSMGSGAPGAESAVEVVWRGELEAGESREIEVRYAAPLDATHVWAEVAAGEGLNARQRARAMLATRGGLAVAAAEPAVDPGRVVTDSETGSQVVEYPGGTGRTP